MLETEEDVRFLARKRLKKNRELDNKDVFVCIIKNKAFIPVNSWVYFEKP